TKQQLIERFQVPKEKIAVIYQTCHETFKKNYPKEAIQAVKTKYHLPKEYLLNVGTIEERKNTLPLVEAMTLVEPPLVLVGKKTDYFKHIETVISDKNLEDKVYVIEDVPIEDLALLYQGAKLFVYTSLIEGFGIPLIEAGYSGLPILCNATGVFPEAAGSHSCLVEDLSPEHLALRINELLSNPEQLQTMAKLGQEYSENFNEKGIAQQWMQLYESMLKN
ncbi:MAG: glycosyltransferase family 1 protein, partial [Flavobacteriaceae bacterium]|nr:glycosyltransferase family 1 protein [Flavobacteriaceae bacterium]